MRSHNRSEGAKPGTCPSRDRRSGHSRTPAAPHTRRRLPSGLKETASKSELRSFHQLAWVALLPDGSWVLRRRLADGRWRLEVREREVVGGDEEVQVREGSEAYQQILRLRSSGGGRGQGAGSPWTVDPSVQVPLDPVPSWGFSSNAFAYSVWFWGDGEPGPKAPPAMAIPATTLTLGEALEERTALRRSFDGWVYASTGW